MWWRDKERGQERAATAAQPESGPAPRAESPVDELCAFLGGRYAVWLAEHGRRVPTWAWLNQAAHAPHFDLAIAAVVEPLEGAAAAWQVAQHTIALEVMSSVADREELDELRREVLVPLELDLARVDLVPPLTPGQLVALTRATLGADWR